MDDLSAHEAHEAVQSIVRDSTESDTVMVSDWVLVAAFEDMEAPHYDEQLSIQVVKSQGLSLYGMVGLLNIGQDFIDVN